MGAASIPPDIQSGRARSSATILLIFNGYGAAETTSAWYERRRRIRRTSVERREAQSTADVRIVADGVISANWASWVSASPQIAHGYWNNPTQPPNRSSTAGGAPATSATSTTTVSSTSSTASGRHHPRRRERTASRSESVLFAPSRRPRRRRDRYSRRVAGRTGLCRRHPQTRPPTHTRRPPRLRRRPPHFKLPESLRLVDDPRTATGKIAKRQLTTNSAPTLSIRSPRGRCDDQAEYSRGVTDPLRPMRGTSKGREGGPVRRHA